MYQNYVDKLMTEQEYMTLKHRYKAEAEEAERLIEALTRQQAAEAAHTPKNMKQPPNFERRANSLQMMRAASTMMSPIH